MAARATKEHEKYASSYIKGAVSLPESSDVDMDLDKCFENPLGPIRPYIRTTSLENKVVVFRTKDIGIYITESIHFKGVDDASLESITSGGGVAYNLPKKDGGVHITLQLIKPFVLEIPCHPDSVDKRVAMCNYLLKITGADTFVHKSEISVSNKHKSSFGKSTNLLKREAGRWEAQLYFTVAWCEDVLADYSRVLRRFDDADGEAKREFYDLAKKMDRAEVLYPEAKWMLEKLAQIPLPLKSAPAWVQDVERVRASEIPKVDSNTENRILRADLAIKEDKCAKLETELAYLRNSLEQVKLGSDKENQPPTPSSSKTSLHKTHPPSLPAVVYTHAIPVETVDPFQQAVRCLVDGMSHQLPPAVYAVMHSIRDTWNGETGAMYRDRVMHTLHSMSMSPPVARALQLLYSNPWA
eukprot:jgi/Mesvir1/1902/Mv22932-RA.1